MTMESQIKDRTKKFGLRCIKMSIALPNSELGKIISRQLIRAGTSVGANYRAACRARSKADFTNKLGIVEEEADECIYWMEVCVESGLISKSLVSALMKEANELLAIVIASRMTASNQKSKIKNQKFL